MTLTPREHQVEALVLDGMMDKEIATRLGIAYGTVKLHVSAILRVRGVRRRTELIARYRDSEIPMLLRQQAF